MTVKFC